MQAAAMRRRGPVSPKPVKARVKGTLVAPEFALKLMAHVGPTAAARAIGTTPGTLHKARNANMISQPLEVAARGIWREQGYADMEAAQAAPLPRTSNLSEAVHAPTAEGTVLMLVQVPRGREEILKKTAEALGGVVTVQA